MPTLKRIAGPKYPKAETGGKNQGRKSLNREVYDTVRWRKLRASVLAENPRCVDCYKQGVLTLATVADHDTPINQGGDPWDRSNIVGRCVRCHNRKSARERHR